MLGLFGVFLEGGGVEFCFLKNEGSEKIILEFSLLDGLCFHW